MITYNHEQYIRTAIESTINQKTDFEFELVIGEDCSTDKTREIVFEYANRYPEIIKVIISDKNVGPLINWKRVYDQCKGKYLAHCEGDDFWNDEYKLQKQVDFLETHLEYGVIHSELNQLYVKNKLIKNFNQYSNNIIPEGQIFEQLLDPSKYLIKTVTTLIRKRLVDDYFEFNNALKRGWKLLDLAIWLECSKHAKIKYLDEPTSTYRVLENSLSNIKEPQQRFEFHKMVYDIRSYYANKYNCSDRTRRKINISYSKILLADAYLLKDKYLIQNAYNMLKNLNCQLSGKEKFLYFIAKYFS